MINENEIRSGSLLLDKERIVTDDGILRWYNDLWEQVGNGAIKLENIEPIPLTPEILEKIGFEKSQSNDIYERTIYGIQVANGTSLYFDAHKDWMRDDNDVEWYLSHEWNNNHFKNDFWNRPKYIHQLQNLFFALTGNELIIDL